MRRAPNLCARRRSEESIATSTGILDSPRRRRRLVALGGSALVAGVAVLVSTVLLRGTPNAFTDTFSNEPATFARKEKTARVTRQQVALMRTFIRTAVARRNLRYAYSIVDGDLKGDMTLRQWRTGNIPVVQYEAENVDTAAFIPIYHYQTQALFYVDLIPVGRTQKRPELVFFIGMKRAGDRLAGRWLIDYWQPHWQPPVEMTPE